ncbi:unnamed protein product, partial [Dovyalis caffra]
MPSLVTSKNSFEIGLEQMTDNIIMLYIINTNICTSSTISSQANRHKPELTIAVGPNEDPQ